MRKKHWTVRDLADYWAVRVQQVLAHVHHGDLEAINIARPGASRPTWRIPDEARQRFEQRNSTAPAPAKARRKKRASAVREYF